jgi:hypothetical protein
MSGARRPAGTDVRRRRGAAVVVASLLLAAACGGDDGDDSAREPDGATTTTTTTTTTAAVPTVASSGPAATTTPTTSARGGPTTSTALPATTTTAAPSPPGLPFTTPGTYRYASAGQFTSTLTGPQSRNGETTLTVDPPSGSDQRSVRRAFSRTTEQVLRLDAGGAHLVYLRLTDQGIDKEVRASPPVLALPAYAAPGRTWTWRLTSTDGLTSVDSTFRALRSEVLAVGDQRVPALVVEVVLSLSGDIVSTLTQTTWVSLERRLLLRQDEASDGRFGVVRFSGSTSETLLALTPG